MKLLSFLVKNSPGSLVTAVLAGVVGGISSAGLLAVVHQALDHLAGIGGEGEGPGRRLAWIFVALVVLASVSRIFAQYLMVRLGEGMVMDLRMNLTRRIVATPLRRIEELGGARLLASLTEDVNAISRGYTQLPTFCVFASVIFGCLGYLAWLSSGLFLLLLGVLAVGVLTYQLPFLAGMRRYQRVRVEQDGLYGHFRSLFDGIRELKLHRGRASAFVSLVEGCSQRLYGLYVTAVMIFGVTTVWGQLVFFVIIGVLIFAVAPGGGQEASDLVGYTLVLLYMMNPLQGLLESFPGLGRAGVGLTAVERLGLALEGERSEIRPRVLPVSGAWRSLNFRGVTYSFAEPGRERKFRLGPLDLEFHPGEIVFLVGGNGSGKTTLGKILCGLYEPEEGEMSLDGRALDEGGREDLRELFSVVFATPYLFDALLGLQGPDLDARARRVLVDLQLEEKLEIQEGRLSTTSLSQGQRKRLALLVAYLEDRSIYLFDEWAADQDPEFREVFYRRILPELKAQGKTVFVISHDDRYFDAADRLIKLDCGRVVFDGSFENHSPTGVPTVEGAGLPAAS